MTSARRPLRGLRVGLSVSGEPQELARFGFSEAGMNRFTVRLAHALLAEGACLAFGHDWRPEGIMEAIASLGIDYHRPLDESHHQPAILNLVPWPARSSSTDPTLLERLEGTVQVTPVGLPHEFAAFAEQALELGPRSPEYLYLRSRGLTHLRRELEEHCQARVAVGGKLRNYQGRLPGIVEEALFALEAGHALYLAGLMGGAAYQLGRVLLGESDPHSVLEDLPLKQLYASRRFELGDMAGQPSEDSVLDPEALAARLGSPDLQERLLANGLSKNENLRLLETTLEEECIHLVLKGLQT